MSTNYRNIAISGQSGVGKNVLLENLRDKLEPAGWHFHKTGDIVRDTVKEFIAPTADLLSRKGNIDIEKRTREILEKENRQVVEAWLAGYVARDFPHVLKILLTADLTTASKRVAQRDHISQSEAALIIQKRSEDNIKKWQRLYHAKDFFNPKYFDLVIDTTGKTPKEIRDTVIKELYKL